jgi:hypothetical protein
MISRDPHLAACFRTEFDDAEQGLPGESHPVNLPNAQMQHFQRRQSPTASALAPMLRGRDNAGQGFEFGLR